MPVRRFSDEYLDGGRDSNDAEMTPMQELTRTSRAVPTQQQRPSSPIFQNSNYGSESTVTTTTSSEADRGLLAVTGEEKKDSSRDSDAPTRAERGEGPDSDSDDSYERSSGDCGGDLRDNYGREVSPIAEVAAVVANTDDPSVPCLTFRFWVMGLISILSLSFINQVKKKHAVLTGDSPMVDGWVGLRFLIRTALAHGQCQW